MIPPGIRKLPGKIFYSFFGLERIFILEIPLPLQLSRNLSRHLDKLTDRCVIRPLDKTSGSLLKEYMRFEDEVDKGKVSEWLDNGFVCYLALIDNRIVGSVWASTKYPPYSNLPRIQAIFKNTPYSLKLFVSQEWRGKAVGLSLTMHMLNLLNDMGFSRTMAMVYDWNRPSLRLLDRLGFKITYRLNVLRAGPVIRHILKPYP